MIKKHVRFKFLLEKGIVESWPALYHLIATQGFPPGIWLSKNTRAWVEEEVEAWLAARPTQAERTPAQREAYKQGGQKTQKILAAKKRAAQADASA